MADIIIVFEFIDLIFLSYSGIHYSGIHYSGIHYSGIHYSGKWQKIEKLYNLRKN